MRARVPLVVVVAREVVEHRPRPQVRVYFVAAGARLRFGVALEGRSIGVHTPLGREAHTSCLRDQAAIHAQAMNTNAEIPITRSSQIAAGPVCALNGTKYYYYETLAGKFISAGRAR